MSGQFKYNICLLLTAALVTTSQSLVIQALIDFDDNSEDLIGSLIRRVDHIIDPANDDMSNVSLSLAHALLKLAPTLSITGNISDGTNSVTLTFSFSATTAASNNHSQFTQQSLEEVWRGRGGGGMLEPVVDMVEPWVLFILEVAAHSILGVIVTQILQATALLENVPFS